MKLGLTSGAALLVALLFVTAPAGADCACCRGPAVAAAPFSSSTHGFSLSLPSAWIQLPRRGADDLAEVRFKHEARAVSGFYQVYEGAVTEKADAWYDNARARYETAARSLPTVDRLEFSELESTTMGGQRAYSFGFVTLFKSGPPVATRIVFTPRRAGERVDMHELVISGEASAVAASRADIEALLEAVRFQ